MKTEMIRGEIWRSFWRGVRREERKKILCFRVILFLTFHLGSFGSVGHLVLCQVLGLWRLGYPPPLLKREREREKKNIYVPYACYHSPSLFSSSKFIATRVCLLLFLFCFFFVANNGA